MKTFLAFRIVRRSTKNTDGIVAWAISLEPLSSVEASSPEIALQAARRTWPFIPRGDLLVGPGDQGSLVHPPEH